MFVVVDTSHRHSHWQQTHLLNTYYYFRFIPATRLIWFYSQFYLLRCGRSSKLIEYSYVIRLICVQLCSERQQIHANIISAALESHLCICITEIESEILTNRIRRERKISRAIFTWPLNVAIDNQSFNVFSAFCNRRTGFISTRIWFRMHCMQWRWSLIECFYCHLAANEIFESIMQNKCFWQMHNNAKIIINDYAKNLKLQFDHYQCEAWMIPLMHSIIGSVAVDDICLICDNGF